MFMFLLISWLRYQVVIVTFSQHMHHSAIEIWILFSGHIAIVTLVSIMHFKYVCAVLVFTDIILFSSLTLPVTV